MKNRSSLVHIIVLTALCGMPGSMAGSQPAQRAIWLTVFIHGMMSVKHHLSLDNFIRVFNDDVEDSIYAKTVEHMRIDDHFFQNQPMQAPGLHKINSMDIKKGNASGAMAQTFNFMFKQSGHEATRNYYYTYGWSGLLSPRARYADAEKFFNALAKEVKRVSAHAKGVPIYVRVIGYSHGGNVALNLAAVRQNNHFDNIPFYVDELMLLGMPVQRETDYLINDPMFKSVYNLYSRGDRVQPLDISTGYTLFSRRTFAPHRNLRLPEKLKQIELRITRCTPGALANPKRFELTKNFNVRHIARGRSHLLHDTSPGHAELWFFGWTPLNYREHFPIYPLPTIAYLPYITKHVESLENIRSDTPVIFDIRPEHDVALLKSNPSSTVLKIIKLVPSKKREEFCKKILHFAPDNYTDEIYKERIRQAYIKASQEHNGGYPQKAYKRFDQRYTSD